MRKSLLVFSLIACAVLAQAQGTIQFAATLTGTNEVPSNADPTIGTGGFSLTGNQLDFLVNVPSVTFIPGAAQVRGPALPGDSGPEIFDLGGPTISPGNDFGTPPVYHYFSPFNGVFGAGPFTLSTNQIADLKNGLWYVNVTSGSEPNGQLRGQILLQGPTLSSLVVTNNSFQFSVTEVAGFTYIVQASSHLCSTNWTSIATNTAPFTFSDTGFTNYPQRFYRALYKP